MAKMNAVMESQLEVTLDKMDHHIGAVESHLASDIARASSRAAGTRGATSRAMGRPAPLSVVASSPTRSIPAPSLSPRNAMYAESASAIPAHFTRVTGDAEGTYIRNERTGVVAWTVEELHQKEAAAAMVADSAKKPSSSEQSASDDLLLIGDSDDD